MNSEYPDTDQRVAVCNSIWRDKSKSLSNDDLVDLIRLRTEKATEFNYGILTADRYVKTMEQAAGLDVCYKFASRGSTSFSDVLQKASRTLVYSNQDMLVQEIKRVSPDTQLEGITLPKNTLMVFKHVLTTPRKDRDGDILRTEGALIDPKLPLLWQHIPTLPIGKMLAVVEHNSKRLVLLSAIVDMGELAYDAAVMVDNDMGRFSHGFRALQFNQLKEEDGDLGGYPGFDIKKFEIMEESIVSIPSNVDAETVEMIVGLVERGKLTSGIMKECGRSMRERLPIMVAAGIQLTEEHKDADQPGDRSETQPAAEEKEPGRGDDSPEEASPVRSEEAEKATEEPEVIKTEQAAPTVITGVVDGPDETKAGRVLSGKVLSTLKECRDDMMEIHDKEELSRGGKALCKGCCAKLDGVIKMAGEEEEDKQTTETVSVKDAMAIFLSDASKLDRQKLFLILQAEKELAEIESKSKSIGSLLRS